MSHVPGLNSTIPLVSHYGYTPTLWVGVVFVTLFGLVTVIHGFQAFHYHRKVFLATAFSCGALETIGWAGRLWSHFNTTNRSPFLMQIVTTICAPTFLVATLFLTLAEIIRRLGPCYSRLQPKLYTIIFVSVDFCSLVIQGVGGGLAATASGTPTTGGHIMLGGICLQLVGISAYSALAIEYGFRYYLDNPFERSEMFRGTQYFDKKMKQMIYTLAVATLFLYIRAVYRVIELNAGWRGSIIRTERWFVIFDGLMILCALWTFAAFHPGRLLREDSKTFDNINGDSDTRFNTLTNSRNTSNNLVEAKLENLHSR